LDVITGWVEELNVWGFRVGQQWVAWAEGGPTRPRPGEYAEIELDADGYVVHVEVRAWRPERPHPN
jgi:hypothetical protein